MGYDDVSPVHYKLAFEPDLKEFTFRGSAEITVQCAKPVNILEMDCAGLDVLSCTVLALPPKGVKTAAAAAAAAPASGHGRGARNSSPTVARAVREGAEIISIPGKNITVDPARERLAIRMPRGCSIAGRALIHVSFAGSLGRDLLGFYLSSYRHGPDTKYLATTQFEAADARRAFPCWDRPDAKATFEISITAFDPKHTAISNMPVAKITRHGGRGSQTKAAAGRTFHFAVTPPMSTYLVYLGVGEFSYVREPAGSAQNSVEIRVVTTPAAKRRLAGFALLYARTLLDSYESYFGIKYPLPKLDLIAIPDFAAGAMENWGAITFRENLLLYDPKKSSTRTKQLVAEVISHELAHQWFGNLVTMKWWNDLWLNESFATFMAIKLLDKTHPEWDLWTQFLTDSMRNGMELDSLHSTHPVDVPVESPAQIREIFDAISYEKGGCILRMLEDYVGEKAFRRGLISYLKKFMYKNARGSDLWDSIQLASNKPVSAMMEAWLGTAGFPVVSLQAAPGGTLIEARQERYTYLKPPRGGRRPKATWPIPMSLCAVPAAATTTTTASASAKRSSRTAATILFSEKSGLLPFDRGGGRAQKRRGAGADLPAVVANYGRTGFYRVRYDKRLLSGVRDLAGSGGLGPHDLWGLQNDLFAMCVSGHAGALQYLRMLDAYAGVRDPAVLSDAASSLWRLYVLASESGPQARQAVSEYSSRFYRRIHDEITGWRPGRGEAHALSLLRGPVLSSLGRLMDPDIVSGCDSLYAALLERDGNDNGNGSSSASSGADPAGGRTASKGAGSAASRTRSKNPVHPDLIEPVCTVIAWTSGSARRSANAAYQDLLDLYGAADTAEQKMRFLGSMCGFRRAPMLARTLRFALSDNVRSQDFFIPVARIAANPHGRGVLWPWVQKNWARISEKVGRGNPLLGRVISSLASACDEPDIPELEQFFADNPVPGTERTLLQTVERIRIAHGMRTRLRDEFGTTNGSGA